MHFQIEAVFYKQRVEAGARLGHVLAAVKLNFDADGFVFFAAIKKLLRQFQVHADITVVQLLEAHIACAVDEEADDIRRSAGSGAQQIDARRFFYSDGTHRIAVARR